MSSPIDTAAIGGTATQAISTASTIMIWVLLVLSVVALVALILWIRSYNKKKVVLFERMANGWQQKEYNAKEFRDKRDQAVKWRLFKLWKTTPRPPGKAIYINDKKKFVAYGALIDDNIVWCDELKLNFTDEKLTDMSFDPLLAEDKALLTHELTQAQSYKKKTMSELLQAAAPMLAIIMILAIFMVFFNQVVEPTTAIGDKLISMADKMDKTTDKLDTLINNRQVLNQDNTNVIAGDNTKLIPD